MLAAGREDADHHLPVEEESLLPCAQSCALQEPCGSRSRCAQLRQEARSPLTPILESIYTTAYKILPVFFSKSISPPLNWDPLIKVRRDRPFLAFPFSEKAVKFSKRSQSQSKVCQELSSLGGCSRSPAGGAGCIIQNSLDPGKENRNQAARARGAAPAPA